MPETQADCQRRLYYYGGGGLSAAETEIPVNHSFEPADGSSIVLKNGKDESLLLLLQGKPIAEPVAQYGPFVMNTDEEINQAFSDYHETSFGGWPWASREPVHSPDAIRFARYADGRTEER